MAVPASSPPVCFGLRSTSAVVALAAVVAAAIAVAGDTSTKPEWWAFAALLPLAAVAPLFRVPVGRNHSLHAGPAFVVAGALVLPPLLVVALVVALHIPLAIRDRYPWYIQTFNIANFTLSGLAAWLAVDAIGQDGDLRFAVSGLAAAAVFVGVNHRPAGLHPAARPRAQHQRDRALLGLQPRYRARDRGTRHRRRHVRHRQPVAHSSRDRTAGAGSPLALDHSAAARDARNASGRCSSRRRRRRCSSASAARS